MTGGTQQAGRGEGDRDSESSNYPRHPLIDDEAEESSGSEYDSREDSTESESTQETQSRSPPASRSDHPTPAQRDPKVVLDKLAETFGSRLEARRWQHLCEKHRKEGYSFAHFSDQEKKEFAVLRRKKTQRDHTRGPVSASSAHQISREPGPSQRGRGQDPGSSSGKRKLISFDDQSDSRIALRCRTAQKVATDRERRKERKKYRKRQFKCELCEKVFSRERERDFHRSSGSHARAIRRRKEEEHTPYCRACERPFPSIHDLKRHIRTAAHEKAAKRRKSGAK